MSAMRVSSDPRESTRRPYATSLLALERSHQCRRVRAFVRRERPHGKRLVARNQHTALRQQRFPGEQLALWSVQTLVN